MIRSDVFRFIDQCREKFDLIFAGPPYALQNIDDLPKLIFEKQLLNEEGWFILEHTPKNNYESFPHFKSSRNYGTTVFSIFEASLNHSGGGSLRAHLNPPSGRISHSTDLTVQNSLQKSKVHKVKVLKSSTVN